MGRAPLGRCHAARTRRGPGADGPRGSTLVHHRRLGALRIPEPWRPLPEVDAGVMELAGPWYWGTHAFALRVAAAGGVSLEPLSGNGRRSRFRANGDGTWTGLEGYYAGELLKAVRRPD